MESPISWTFGELEAVLASVHDIDQSKRTAFQARLKNFHRLGFPLGFEATKGKASKYTPLQIVEMALALEMTQLGLPPERTCWIFQCNRWATLMAVAMAAEALHASSDRFDADGCLSTNVLSMFIYFNPSALWPLTTNLPASTAVDWDGAAASFFYGGIGIVQDRLAAWTSGFAPRISMINVTAMISGVASSPYEQGSDEHADYVAVWFQHVETAARHALDQFSGGTEAETNYAVDLLEQGGIGDAQDLAFRMGITLERAAGHFEVYHSNRLRAGA